MAYATSTRQNMRSHMEDMVCVCRDLRGVAPFPEPVQAWLSHQGVQKNAPVSLAMVADGHGGEAAAQFCIQRLPGVIATLLVTGASAAWAKIAHHAEQDTFTQCEAVTFGGTPESASVGRQPIGAYPLSPTFASSTTASPPDGGDSTLFSYESVSITAGGAPPLSATVQASHMRTRCVSQDVAWTSLRPPSHFRRYARSSDTPSEFVDAVSADCTTDCVGMDDSVTDDSDADLEVVVRRALTAAVAQIDSEYCEIARSKRAADGCCVNFALILGTKLFVANVGDCRAVLIDATGVAQLSQDHKPNLPQEMDRIISVGGSVKYASGEYRVFPARIAVSRTIGDVKWKDRGLLTSACDITVTELTSAHRWLVLASDGVWSKLSCTDVKDVLRPCTFVASSGGTELPLKSCCGFRSKDVKGDPIRALISSDITFLCAQHPSDTIADAAICKGSTDNVSVIAIALPPLLQWLQRSPHADA